MREAPRSLLRRLPGSSLSLQKRALKGQTRRENIMFGKEAARCRFLGALRGIFLTVWLLWRLLTPGET
jgi:hypothetical protein